MKNLILLLLCSTMLTSPAFAQRYNAPSYRAAPPIYRSAPPPTRSIGPVGGAILGLGAGVVIGSMLSHPAPVYHAPPPVIYAPPPVVYVRPSPPVYGAVVVEQPPIVEEPPTAVEQECEGFPSQVGGKTASCVCEPDSGCQWVIPQQ